MYVCVCMLHMTNGANICPKINELKNLIANNPQIVNFKPRKRLCDQVVCVCVESVSVCVSSVRVCEACVVYCL